MPRPLVFLDIDGVLVNLWSMKQGRRELAPGYSNLPPAPECVERLNHLTRTAGADIVLTSTWRLTRPFMRVKEALTGSGIEAAILDRTPSLDGERGGEIQAWLDTYPHEPPFVILDDDSDMLHLAPRLVLTDPYVGLTDDDVQRALDLLHA